MEYNSIPTEAKSDLCDDFIVKCQVSVQNSFTRPHKTPSKTCMDETNRKV